MSEARKRTCRVPDGDLIDLAWGKLDPEREGRVLRHAISCAECAAELEALKGLRESVGSAADLAPSVGFHERLMDRVRGAGRATPPSGLHKAGSATRRYAKILERERSARSWVRPRWKLLVLATSAAACLSAVMLTRMWVLDSSAPSGGAGPVAVRPEARRAVFTRYAERKECVRRVDTEIIDGRLDLANALGDGGPLGEILGEDEIVLAGVEDPDEHESCLMAFRAADWLTFSLKGRAAAEGPGRERFEAIAKSKRVVAIVDGQIDIPDDLRARHIGGTSVVVLKLTGRAEIWSRKALKSYIGLPPFRINVDGLTLAPPRDKPQRS